MLTNSQAERAEGNLINPYPAPIWPGLIGSELDVDSGNYLTYDFGWHAGIDSFLEVRTASIVNVPTMPANDLS